MAPPPMRQSVAARAGPPPSMRVVRARGGRGGPMSEAAGWTGAARRLSCRRMSDARPHSDPAASGSARRLGPLLRLRGSDGPRVRLALTLAVPEGGEPPAVSAGDDRPEPMRLGALGGAAFWSWDFEAPAGSAGRYAVGGVRHGFALPEPGGALRVAYASCNGGEDEAHASSLPGGRDAMWRHLLARHEAAPFHLLVMGGDQIYADALWELPTLRAWSRLGRRARLAAPFEEAMRAELEAHYLATYASVFGAPDVAAALARIPSSMMWDDHDIVDGWGSRSPSWQASPVAQGLFATARRAFALVQLGRDPDRPPEGHAAPDGAHFGWSGTYGPARIVVPDLRSERTRARVMGPSGRAALARALEGFAEPHLLMVSSVPLVNVDLSGLERLVRPLMPVADLYQDDLRDQWMSHAHAEEWAELMGRLLAAAARGARVTVLSGEIHFGARGTAERDGARIEQLTASGIAHPPPPRGLARVLDRLARRPWRRAGVRLEMHPLTPGGPRYLAQRNWLEVSAQPDGGLDAVLHGETSGPLRLTPPRSGREEDTRPDERSLAAPGVGPAG